MSTAAAWARGMLILLIVLAAAWVGSRFLVVRPAERGRTELEGCFSEQFPWRQQGWLLPRSNLGFEKADRAALSSPLHISNRGRSAERRGEPGTLCQLATRLIVPLASMSCSCFRRFFS